MNLMQNGAAWLGGKLKTAAGRTVTIRQGAKSIDVTAVSLVKRSHDVVKKGMATTQVEMHDWTFASADLGTLELRVGTEIVETVNGTKSKYEAMPVGDKPCFEPADASGTLLILHTEKVE